MARVLERRVLPRDQDSVATDAQGNARLPLAADGSHEIEVNAQGYWPTRLEPDPFALPPLRVTLLRSNALIVTAVAEERERLEGLYVAVHRDGAGQVFAARVDDQWVGDLPTEHHWSIDCHDDRHRDSAYWRDAGVRVELCRPGPLKLHGLRPDVSLTLELTDEARTTLSQRVLPPLGPEEVRELRLDVPGGLRSLSGIVVDAAGTPISGAWVGIVHPSGAGHKETDAEGRFSYAAIKGTVSLRIRKRGFAAAHFENVTPPLDGAPLGFVLEEGLSIDISLTDENGRPLSGAQFRAGEPPVSGHLTAEMIAPGLYRVTDLPVATVPIHASVAGRTYTIDHAAGGGDAAMVVPPHAPLTIEWEEAPPPVLGVYIVLLHPWEGDAPERPMPSFGQLRDGVLELPNVAVGEHRLILGMSGSDGGNQWYVHAEPVVVGPDGARVRFVPDEESPLR